jgi:bilin biosynthesis protein
LESKIWDLKYAALLALEKFGDRSDRDRMTEDADWLVREKAQTL